MAEIEELEYEDYTFLNTFVIEGETDFIVMKEEGVTRYTKDRSGKFDYENPELLNVKQTNLFEGVILDCEAYLRLYEQGKIKPE